MNFDADLSPDELKVFLEEANEQIELMDEDIVRLEKEGDDPELLQEIFRAAHTIKGSSAMIGFQTMAELTHSMESLLDKLRNKALSVSTEIIDALLYGLDILKLLMDSINEPEDETPDIKPAVAKLKEVTEQEASEKISETKPLELGMDRIEELHESLESTENALKIIIDISEDSDWPAVRCMQIFNELSNRGEIIDSSPTEEEIEEDTKALHLEIAYKTNESSDTLYKVITSIGDIDSVNINTYGLETESSVDIVVESPDTDDLTSENITVDNSPEDVIVPEEAVEESSIDETTVVDDIDDDVSKLLNENTEEKIEENIASQDLPSISEDEIKPEIPENNSSETVEPIVETPVAVKEEPASVKKETPKKRESKKQETSQSVRVDVEVLDSLLNVVEELVIDRSKISQVGKMLESKYPGDDLIDELSETSDHIIKTINELQEYIMQARMVPIGTIFSRFPRMVRDLAQSQSKKLDFSVEGADTELDRTIIEQIRDPLTHLLRNAVDHGIEPLEQRLSAGKPETAKVKLNAYREQSHIIITVEDDGKGISGEKIKETAIRKGLITPAKAETLSETEAINLVFLAGMSTTEKATEVSGRGVGMDIVRANVESLGGTTAIETQAGQGSKFIIKLPLTVAIVQGFLISVSEQIYILPMGSIAETVLIDNSQIQTIQNRQIIRWRDSLIPLIRLNKVFNSGSCDDCNTTQENKLIVIVNSGDRLVGLEIDELLEQQEIVVKSLGNYLGDVEGIAGATILGDGNIALILDISTLIKKVVASGNGFSVMEHGVAV